ncbi:competence protein CoiA family protein [Parabacteroides distasonis]|jgi:hypothetical protein|uniref:hypothetical protein n=1 Tax=Parabacteroides distasonis TaxID=823 RepID=UPI001922ACC7|nr:hypothetical protein [Parabacteroides distasonis]
MNIDFVFSWAENEQGKMVHVDDVPRGIQCGCRCPYCHERLLARHGEVRQHGFAHYSDTRGANLKICYVVTMYKLAEQIIQSAKRIHAPSYYGIFPEMDIEFIDVRIDCCFERADKQPDVIATTKEGRQYLIEFLFQYKIQHKTAIDYKNMNCLEIDLSNQSLETLESFLLSSSKDRKWMNNVTYFSQVGSLYNKAGKPVRVVDESECRQCELGCSYHCAGVPVYSLTGINQYLVIEESGHKYRLCKSELFQNYQQEYERIKSENERKERIEEKERLEAEARKKKEEEELKISIEKRKAELAEKRRIIDEQEALSDPSSRTCFQCEYNLQWANRNGYANCGAWKSMSVPQKTPPSCARACKRFRRIIS